MDIEEPSKKKTGEKATQSFHPADLCGWRYSTDQTADSCDCEEDSCQDTNSYPHG